MRVAVVGTGRMGTGLARALARSHEVAVGSRDPERGRRLAAEVGAAWGGGQAEAVRGAEVVFLAVPWVAVEETLARLGDLAGTVLVDLTNPYVDGKLRFHEGSSNAEEIGRRTSARVVKGWNTLFSQVVASSPDFDGQAASVFLAGDDEDAKATVAGLARDMGYDPIDSGPLQAARSLERLLGTLGTLGHPFERGTYALKVLRRSGP